MVVGKKEPTDLKMEIGAKKIKAGGRVFEPANKGDSFPVYSDKTDKDRRDVFVPNKLRRTFGGDAPKKAKVYYSGKYRPAELSFRYAGGGRGPVPVYTFEIE